MVASRRSTKLRSWTRTTNPSGRPPSASGTAVAWTCPPGTEKTDDQAVPPAAAAPPAL